MITAGTIAGTVIALGGLFVAPTAQPGVGGGVRPPETNVREQTVWDDLADCESGLWDRDGDPIPGTARWDLNQGAFDGGLQFHPDTWTWLRPDHYPHHAHQATRRQQIAVARRTQRIQGWEAWPNCSSKVGLR